MAEDFGGGAAVADVEVSSGGTTEGTVSESTEVDGGTVATSVRGDTTSDRYGTGADESVPGSGGEESETRQTAAEEATEPGFEALPKQYKKDKFVKALFHEQQRMRQAFPGGVNEALKFKQTIDQIGGLDEIPELHQRALGAAQIDKDFAEGNPAVIEDFVAESPEGFAKIMGPAIDKLAQVDKQTYDHVMGKVFWATLNSGPVRDLASLETALRNKDFDGAMAELQRVGKFLNTMEDLANKIPEKKIDPERQKFEKEKTDWEQSKQTDFRNSIKQDVEKYAVGKVETQLAKEFSSRSRNLAELKQKDPESYQILLENCYNAVRKSVATNADLNKRANRAASIGKREDAIKILQSGIDGTFSEAVSKTFQAFYRVGGTNGSPSAAAPKTPQQQGQKPATNGILQLSKAPTVEQLDKARMYREFGKDKTDTLIFRSQGYLKGKPNLYRW